jgi:hypothetical protein
MMTNSIDKAFYNISGRALVALLRAMMGEAEENDRHNTKLD